MSDPVLDLYEENYAHFDFMEEMNGGDCECELHKAMQLLQG